MERIRVEQHGSVGLLWIAAWLFTVGYLDLTVGKIILAIIIWPYYLGDAFSLLAS